MIAEVYRNLTTKLISVRQDSLVVCHAESITLKNPFFKVRESGRQLVLKTKEKNVHAFVCGEVVNIGEFRSYKSRKPLVSNPESIKVEDGLVIKYNPYKHSQFFVDDLKDVPSNLSYVTVYSDGKILAF